MKPIIYFRGSLSEENELNIAKQYFDVVESRVGVKNKLVIPRYSALPFYKELEYDVEIQGSKLINSYEQHKYIADFEYYNDIRDYTPETYFSFQDIPDNGMFVVKGKTNSRKFHWNSLMFAEGKQNAILVACDLQRDALISQQDIIVREFVPLEKVDDGINGLPISNEWRFFCYKNETLSYGFYWSEVTDKKRPDIDDEAFELIESVKPILSDRVNFFVVDVAKTNSGQWIVIECNDGQQSGLSANDPHILYKKLHDGIVKHE